MTARRTPAHCMAERGAAKDCATMDGATMDGATEEKVKPWRA